MIASGREIRSIFTEILNIFFRDASGAVEPGCENHVCQNVILNLSAGRIRDIVGFALIAAIVLSYIVILVPAREHIERYVLRSVVYLVYVCDFC